MILQYFLNSETIDVCQQTFGGFIFSTQMNDMYETCGISDVYKHLNMLKAQLINQLVPTSFHHRPFRKIIEWLCSFFYCFRHATREA